MTRQEFNQKLSAIIENCVFIHLDPRNGRNDQNLFFYFQIISTKNHLIPLNYKVSKGWNFIATANASPDNPPSDFPLEFLHDNNVIIRYLFKEKVDLVNFLEQPIFNKCFSHSIRTGQGLNLIRGAGFPEWTNRRKFEFSLLEVLLPELDRLLSVKHMEIMEPITIEDIQAQISF